ncbi:MAG: hypothetical protein JO097_04455 [Acidobacteriaceae bacterium]|nr:hypothetical protein [Acidobacteriaceae bacterium]MBV9295728.1 hypothetical protein [Acidobacteriaceae bacterium]MBV9766877.1 hypothetical protein [Acidobacteriaceae bacterium]
MRPSAFMVLAAFVSLFSCAKHAATGIAVDSAFRAFIPPDTKVLAGLRADQLKTSPLYKRHQKQLQIPLLDAFAERVGFDPRRDLSDLLVAWNGKQPVFLARGGITQAELEQRLSSFGAQRAAYRKYTLFGTPNESLFFAKKNVAVAGPAEALRHTIDIHEDGSGGVPDELQQRLEALPKYDQVWAVSRQGLPFADVPMRSDIGSALSNIVAFVTGASVGIGLDTGAHLQMEITCISDQGAQRVRDALRGGIGLARLTTKDNEPDMLRLYDSIHVDQDQQLIHVRADLSADLADKLLARLPQLHSLP